MRSSAAIVCQLQTISQSEHLSAKDKCRAFHDLYHFDAKAKINEIAHQMNCAKDRASITAADLYLSTLMSLLLNDPDLASDILNQLAMPMNELGYPFIEFIFHHNRNQCGDIYYKYFLLLLELNKNTISKGQIYHLLSNANTNHNYAGAEDGYFEFLQKLFGEETPEQRQIIGMLLCQNCHFYKEPRNFLQHLAISGNLSLIKEALHYLAPIPTTEVVPFWKSLTKSVGKEKTHHVLLTYLIDHPSMEISSHYQTAFSKNEFLRYILHSHEGADDQLTSVLTAAKDPNTSLGKFFWFKRHYGSSPSLAKGTLAEISAALNNIVNTPNSFRQSASPYQLLPARRAKTRIAVIEDAPQMAPSAKL